MYDEELGEDKYIEEYNDAIEIFHDPINRREMASRKNYEIIKTFLGKGPQCVEAHSTARWYGKLLAWSIKCSTSSSGCETVSYHGYSSVKPIFWNIQTDYTSFESCMTGGQVMVEKEGIRLVVSVVARDGFVQIEAGEEHHHLVKKLIKDIVDFSKDHNFYRGKRLTYDGEISFLNAGQRDWKSVIIDTAMKKEIRLNTISFLKNCSRLEKYGVPPKRGIILAGEPGMGKTMICKALISEADGITCLTTSAYGVLDEGYSSFLFAIAQDLSPSIIFIEDMDSIGQERHNFIRGTTSLFALLAEGDGIAEKTSLVVVATTNCYETLDKALSERPSRFDRVFKITRPNSLLRNELVKNISEKIPLSDGVMEYIVKVTDGYSPAQILGVIHGMVLSHIDFGEETMQFSRNDVDSALTWVNIRKNGPIGFNGLP